MDYRRVLAIDAGTRNFAYALLDTLNWREPLVWKKVDLWAPEPGRSRKPSKQDMVDMTIAWIRDNEALFNNTDLVVLEAQIRTPFIIMNAVLQTHCYDKCRVVSPMTVAAYFKMPKTRELKKAAGIAIVKQFSKFDGTSHAKLDDLADAWLMAAWGLVECGGLSGKELFLLK